MDTQLFSPKGSFAVLRSKYDQIHVKPLSQGFWFSGDEALQVKKYVSDKSWIASVKTQKASVLILEPVFLQLRK